MDSRAKFHPEPKKNFKYRINNEIDSPKVRVVMPSGKHEILSIHRALDVAHSFDLDLVEIAPNAMPPVCRIIDFGKLVYNQKKKEKRIKDKQHQVIGVKEIRLRPHTEEHDFMFKMRHAERFLNEGSKVRIIIQFKGRDIHYTQQGQKVLINFSEKLSHCSSVNQEPELKGRQMSMVLIPLQRK